MIVLGITAVIHLYLWWRLVRDPVTSPRGRRIGVVAVTAAALVLVATMFGERLLPSGLLWLTAPGYVWLGVMFYLLVALLVLELPVAVALLVGRLARRRRRTATAPAPAVVTAPGGAGVALANTPGGDRSPVDAGGVVAADDAPRGDRSPAAAGVANPSRRRLLRQTAAVVAGAAAFGLSGYGVVRAYRPPVVRRLQVPLSRLDPRADGLRVAVLGDLHIGPLYGGRQVERVVELINQLDADLITVVGDLVSSEVGAVRRSALPLRRLRSRYGTYFVTGNHEYYTGHEEWIEAADELGMRVLRNERVEIVHRGGAIDLAGVNDREGSRYDDPPDYAAALADRDPSRPVVLLAHQPVQVHQAAAYGVDLQLSGHTHGGQVVPFNLLVRLDQPVVAGLAEIDGTRLYVTRGAGFWGPPMRVGAEPELTLLELRAA